MRQVVRSYNAVMQPGEPQLAAGPPPSGLKRFLKDRQLRSELTAAAGLAQVLQVAATREDLQQASKRVALAERMCHAFMVYQKLVPNGHLTLEHVIVLVQALARREWTLERCDRCQSFVLSDPLSLARRMCTECRDGRHLGREEPFNDPAYPRPPDAALGGHQQSLF
jgi:hypothetical protein